MHYITLPPVELQDMRAPFDASDLGLPVGMWPAVIVVNHCRYYDRAQRIPQHSGEFAGYEYTLRGGEHTLVIFND